MKTMALVGLAVLAFGCGSNGGGGGGGGGGDGGNGLTGDQACGDVATARCAKRQTCSNGARVTRDFGDQATCFAREKLGCLAGLNAPSTGQSPAKEEVCAAAYGGQSCSDFFLGNPPTACVQTGSVATGGACAFAGQCQTTYCTKDKTTGCGQCGDGPGAGASCANDFCARGLECVFSTMTCVSPGATGALCNRASPCGPGMSCVGATAAMMGTCQTAVATSGTACDPAAKMGPACDPNLGLACNPMTKVCGALGYAADGMPCGLLADGSFASCARSGQCVIATGMTMGTCKAAAADGAACDLTAGPPCLAPARCITGGAANTAGICQIPDATKCM